MINKNNIFRTSSFFLLTVGVLIVSCSTGKKVKAPRPNIIYIMSDDHATNAISAYGSRLSGVLKTPNIDRLAREGAMLENCFAANSICVPSRASILTGQYSHINGVKNLSDRFDTSKVHVGHLLQESGYQTAIIGKWHLWTEPQGFDYWNVLHDQGEYFNPMFKMKGLDSDTPYKERQRKTVEGYATDVITDLALDWMEKRESDEPFFLMVHHKAPHSLWEYHPKYEHLFDSIDIPEPKTLFEDKSHRSLASRDKGWDMLSLSQRMSGQIKTYGSYKWPTGNLDVEDLSEDDITKKTYQKYLKDYLRVVASIDENVGRVLDYLDDSGLAKNTIVIYTSDQGMFLGEHDLVDKRFMFEESIRMPFLIRYPEHLKGDVKIKDLVSNVDFAPTFLDFAGVEKPNSMQGRSFKSVLENKTPDDWQKELYYRYWQHNKYVPAHFGIRTHRYKLILYYAMKLVEGREEPDESNSTPGWELYDLKNDPQEINNVYNNPAYVDIVAKLKKQLLLKRKELNDMDEKYPVLQELLEKEDFTLSTDH